MLPAPPGIPRAVPRAAARAISRAVTAVAAVLLLAGCTGTSETPEPEASPSATPLSAYDTSEVVVQRAPFCDRVAQPALEEAVGEGVAPEDPRAAWMDGDRIALPPGPAGTGRDVVQEYGCRWEGPTGTAAAWVVAPPVTRRLARALIASQPEDCTPLPDASRYGRPSVALRCPGGEAEEVRYAGLFGDAWLTCALGGPDVTARSAGRWCVAVAEAAAPAG